MFEENKDVFKGAAIVGAIVIGVTASIIAIRKFF